MLILANTTTRLQVVTSNTASIQYSTEFDDLADVGALKRGTTLGAISTATTTSITPAPAANTERSVKQVILKNIDGVNSGTVLLQKYDGTSAYDLVANVALAPQESLVYQESVGFSTYSNAGVLKTPVLGATATYANGTLVLTTANLNFNNTATINVSASSNGASQANISLSANGTALGIPAINTALGTMNTATNVALADALAAYAEANGAYTQANLAYTAANSAQTQANTAYSQANSAYGQANAAYGQANLAYGQANAAYGQANLAYTQANAAANLVAVYANGTLTMANANVNFNNSATVNVAITANGANKFANIAFSMNTSAITNVISLNVSSNIANVGNIAITQNTVTGNLSVTTLANVATLNASNFAVNQNGAVKILGVANINFNNTASVLWTVTANGANQANVSATSAGAVNNYQADVLANGTVALANANLNFNNTATVTVSVVANGASQANISFTANTTKLSGALANLIVVVPLTGFTANVTSNTSVKEIYYIMNPAANLASGQLTLPDTTFDGQIVQISTVNAIIAFTLLPGAGQTLTNAPTTLSPPQTSGGAVKQSLRCSLIFSAAAPNTWFVIGT